MVYFHNKDMPEIISIQHDSKNPSKFTVKKFFYSSKSAKVIAMSLFVIVFSMAVRSISNINNTQTVEQHAQIPAVISRPTSIITQAPKATNASLGVVIISPLNRAIVKAGSVVPIRATATGNGITKVQFYMNNILLCSLSSAPYQCNWQVPQNHLLTTYILKVTVYDSSGSNVSYSIQVFAT